MTEATISEIIAAAAVAFFVGMAAVLIKRRRKHLKLVVRVVGQDDCQMLTFLEQLVQRGDLVAVPMAS
jgi:hypothetical protein